MKPDLNSLSSLGYLPDGSFDFDVFSRINMQSELIWLYTFMDVKSKELHQRTGANIDEALQRVAIVKKACSMIGKLHTAMSDLEVTIASQKRMIEMLRNELPHKQYTPQHLIRHFINPDKV